MNIYQPVISGSLTVTGSTTFFGNITINSGSLTMTSGSLSGTASLASNALLLQGTGSVGFATTASLLEVSSSQQQISSSLLQVSSSQQQISASLLNVVANYATTGSNSFRANQSITGSLVVSSTITAQTLVVQTVTSSIVYSSGSNNFGNQLANTQTFTGSVNITGSLNVVTTGTEFQVTNTGVILGNLSTDNHAITGSLNMTGSLGINAASSFRFNGVGDNSHAVGYDATVDGAFLRGQNGIRLITGGGSGIERMRISAAGTASFTSNTLSNSADAATINLKQNSTTANTGIYLERSGEQKGYYIYMGGSVDSLTFQRNNAGTKADVMSLTRDGNVGIGIASPATLDAGGVNLQIKDRSALFQLAAVNSTYLSNNIYYDGNWKRIVSGYGALIRLNDDSNGFSFLTTGTAGANSAVTFTSALAITNTGTSTFTTTDNQGGVYVTSATDNTTIRVASTATGGQEWRLQSTGGTSGLGQGKLIFKVGGTETASYIPLTLTTDNSTNGGRVGIGNTAPSAKLDVNGQISQGSINQLRTASGTQAVSTTADVFRFLNGAGSINNGCYSAIFHIWVTDNNTGANASSYTYAVQTTSNGQTNAAFTVLSSVGRGVNPVSSLNLISDGAGGAAKISMTTSATPTAGVSYQCSAIGIF